MTKMATMSIHGKNKNIKMSSFKSSENIQKKEGEPDRSVSDKTLQKSSPRDRQTDFHETWYVASGTQSVYSVVYSNDGPGVSLTYFTAKSNFVTKAFL